MEIAIAILVAAAVFTIGFVVGSRHAYSDAGKMTIKAADAVEKTTQLLAPDVKAGATWALMEFLSSIGGDRLPSEALAKARYDSIIRPKKDS
jgi:hypothetical protein